MGRNRKKTAEISRRYFIRNTAVAAGSFFIVPRHVLGRGYVAPSDKLNIAGIGAGGKGESDIAEMAKSPNVNIIAFADVDERMIKKTRESFPKAKYYVDYREMLEEEKSIDAVTISTPDHTHAVATLAAMQLGKHVYTQKPLTHNIYEARMLTEAAKRYKVVTQMGNQGASNDGVRLAREMYDAGMIGDVHTAHAWTNRPVWPQGVPTPTGNHPVPPELNWDLWLGPAKEKIEYHPAYVPFNWRGWWAFGTGALGDMACHIMEPIYKMLPILYPDSAECSVANVWKDMWSEANYVDSCPPSSIIHLNYPRTDGKGNIKVSWYDGGLFPPRPDELLPEEPFGTWDGGLLLEGTKGKMLMDIFGDNPRLLPTKKMKEITLPKQKYARVPERHYLQWVNACIAGHGKKELSSPFEFAGPFTESILMGNLAIRSWMMLNPARKGWDDKYLGRKRLLWDAKNMKVTNFDDANQFVKREYRDGWGLKM